MKYCVHCGAEMNDNDAFCGKCGTPVESSSNAQPSNAVVATTSRDSSISTVAKVFMILSTIFLGFFIIPLCWTVPMTISYCRKVKNNEPVSVAFGICVLLFVNVISGICILVDND